MNQFIDTSVYPDQDPPRDLISSEQKADYLHRIIGAFDQGITPEEPTLRLLAEWQEVFDRLALVSSPGYHALRSYFDWPPLRRETFFVEPTYRILDSLERREDGFEDQV